MTNNIWRKLAELTGPCPGCGDSGRGKPTLAEPDGAEGGCPACHGKGEAPLIPGLRVPCPYATQGHVHSAEGLIVDAHLSVTTCPGWLLVDEDRAIVEAQAFILSQHDELNDYWSLSIRREQGHFLVTVTNTWRRGYWAVTSDYQPTYAAALAQALERALKKEKP